MDRNIHNNPIAPNTTGYGYHNCEETTIKAKKSETLQQKPIKTTEIHHGFHHTEQPMKSQLQPSIFHLQRITYTVIPEKTPCVYTVANLKKTQTNTLPSQRSFHT
jgi:hypothetical protein